MELENEIAENGVHTAGAEKTNLGRANGEFSFKKFKSVEALEKAYSSLESEFTKRSQKIKELEGEQIRLLNLIEQTNSQNNSKPRLAENLEEFIQQNPKAVSKKQLLSSAEKNFTQGSSYERAYIEILEAELESLGLKVNDQNFLLGQIQGTGIKDIIVKEYLEGVKNSNSGVPILSGGTCALAPPKKPKTFKEAGLMARAIINKK